MIMRGGAACTMIIIVDVLLRVSGSDGGER